MLALEENLGAVVVSLHQRVHAPPCGERPGHELPLAALVLTLGRCGGGQISVYAPPPPLCSVLAPVGETSEVAVVFEALRDEQIRRVRMRVSGWRRCILVVDLGQWMEESGVSARK